MCDTKNNTSSLSNLHIGKVTKRFFRRKDDTPLLFFTFSLLLMVLIALVSYQDSIEGSLPIVIERPEPQGSLFTQVMILLSSCLSPVKMFFQTSWRALFNLGWMWGAAWGSLAVLVGTVMLPNIYQLCPAPFSFIGSIMYQISYVIVTVTTNPIGAVVLLLFVAFTLHMSQIEDHQPRPIRSRSGRLSPKKC